MSGAASNSDAAEKLVSRLRKSANALVEELSIWKQAHEKADEEGKLLVEVLALYTTCDALDILLVFADNKDAGLKEPLNKLKSRLDAAARRGAPGLSPREQQLRWFVVAAVEVLVSTGAMKRNEALDFTCKKLKKNGIYQKRRLGEIKGGHRRDIKAETIKGWAKSARSAKGGWPEASPEQGREFVDRLLDHLIPKLSDAAE